MEDKQPTTKYNQLGVPKEIILQNGTYTFKSELQNSILSYRCKHRACKAKIKITTDDAKKLLTNEGDIRAIEYTIQGEHDKHPKNQLVEDTTDKIKTNNENINIAKKLILKNLDLPLSFHIKNLESNKINIPKIKIKNILQLLREELFPKDDEYLEHIELIKIDLGSDKELRNLNICHIKEAFINSKTKKTEKIVIFTTIFQLKILNECEELYIDGTFKMAPKKFYQILNIWGFLKSKKFYLPLIHIIMTSKNYIAYRHVFNNLKLLLTDNNIENNFSNKIITTDYEKSLRRAIYDILNPKYINGCYFHFSKCLWKKCRDYGLTVKTFRKDSILFTFCLKIFPFVHNSNRPEYLEKLKEFVKNKDKRFQKFYKYFIKNWAFNKSYNFNRISNENYLRRTNNICESFHRTLNKKISHNHPKIAYLVDQLKFFANEAYKKYTAALVNNKPENNETDENISKDIFEFIKKFHNIYAEKLDIDKLIENLNEEKTEVYDICKKFIDLVFTDGDIFFNYLYDKEDVNNKESDSDEDNDKMDNFEIEKNNLTDKLNNLNLEDDINDINENDTYEERETLIEYDKLNYIKNKNGTRKLVIKLKDNIIDKLYVFKKK